MADGSMTVAVSGDLIKPVIEAKINAAIAAALSSEAGLIGAAVQTILQMKVNHDGTIPNHYDRDRAIPYIQYLTHSAVKAATQEALKTWIKDSHEAIKAELVKQLEKDKKNIAAQLLAGFVQQAMSNYRSNINVAITAER